MRCDLRLMGGLALLLGSCGGQARTATQVATIDLGPRPSAGARYEIVHHEARQVADDPPTSIVTRTLLEIIEVLPDGARRVRARLSRSDRDEGEDAALSDAVARFDISPTGQLLGEPELLCGNSDEMRLTRYLRHLLGARAIVARGVGEGSRWRASYLSDATELPSRAMFRLDQINTTSARGRLSATVAAEQGDIGTARVTGEGRVRGRFVVSLVDGFAGTTDLRSEISGVILTDGAERRGVVRTRSQIRVRRLPRANDTRARLSLSCDFSPNAVTSAIRRQIAAIQQCYERELASDPALNGRILIRFRVQSSGHVTDATATEIRPGLEGTAACAADLLQQMRISPAPVGDPVTFAYPFVFAPQN